MERNTCTKEEGWRCSIQKAQAGDKGARDDLVTDNVGLIYMVLKRFAGRFRSGQSSQYVFVKGNAANKGQGNVMQNSGTGVQITVPAPGVPLAPGEVAGVFTIPWSKFGKKPAPGEKWLFNALCDYMHPQHGRIYASWEHNFDQATWRNTLDRPGTLQF